MDTSLRTHPLVVIAATAVILTCLLAAGILTGIVPSPLTRQTAPTQELSTAPAAATAPATSADTAQNRYAPATSGAASQSSLVDRGSTASTTAPTTSSRARVAERAPRASSSTASSATGVTSGEGATQSVAASAPPPPPVCHSCGTVTSVRAIRQQGEASMVGPAAGGLIGGVVGHQIGSGRGNTVATVLGAGVGAAAGTEIERRAKSTTHYVVNVKMNDGAVRHFNYASAPGFHVGDRVRVREGRLVRQ
jgi:outer membrane lipoprotein SlyB